MINQVNYNSPPSHFSSTSQEYKNKVTTYPDKTVEEVVKVLLKQQSPKQAAGKLEVNPSTLNNYITFAGRYCKGNTDLSTFSGRRSILDKIVNKYNEMVSKDPCLKPEPKPKNKITTNPNETTEEAVKLLLNQQSPKEAAKALDVNVRSLGNYVSFARKKLCNNDTDFSSFNGNHSLLKKIVNKYNEIVSKDPSLKPEWAIMQNSKPDSKRKRKLRDPSEDEQESNKSVNKVVFPLVRKEPKSHSNSSSFSSSSSSISYSDPFLNHLPKTADASDKSGKKRKISDFNEAEKKARLFGISLEGEPQWVIDHYKSLEQDSLQVKSSFPETDELSFYSFPESISEVSSNNDFYIPQSSTSSVLLQAPSIAQPLKKLTSAIVLNSNITTSSSSISSSVINFSPSSIPMESRSSYYAKRKESKEERVEETVEYLSDNPFEPISNFNELTDSDLVDAYLEWTSKATKTIDTSVPVETRMPTDYPLLMIDALVQLPKDQNLFAEKYGFNAAKFERYKNAYKFKGEKSRNSSKTIIQAAILINELNQENLGLKVSTIPTPAAQV